jgi:hypothetical protein
MPTIVTATELRNVMGGGLGVSSALFDDNYLNGIIDTAEGVILPMLVSFKSPIQEAELKDNVATFTTLGIHEFTEGQSVVIAGCGTPYNGTRTILADNLGQYTFSCAITNADVASANIIPSGTATLSTASTYVGVQPVKSAVLAVSLEVFQSRLAGGGQIEGVDFTSTPFRMGRSLFNKCVGLLGSYLDVEAMVQ